MDNIAETYFLIADAHVAGREAEQEFFRLLETLAALPPSVGVVFLGDIFELWIALRKYETEAHHRFESWCTEQKQKREIIFTEGNHEFFLRKPVFTRAGRCDIRCGDTLFTHGDRINPRDIPYLFFRMGVRNFFTKSVLYLTGPAFGPKVAENIRLSLKGRKNVHKKNFPEDAIRQMMRNARRNGIRTIILGHFHDGREFELDGIRLYALPAFQNTGIAAVYRVADGEYRSGPWQDIAAELAGNSKQGEQTE